MQSNIPRTSPAAAEVEDIKLQLNDCCIKMKQIQGTNKLEKTIEHQEMEINSCKQQMTDLELKYKDKMEELMAQNRALMRQQTEQSDDFENYDETVTTVVAANYSLSIKENDLEDGYKQDEGKYLLIL
uniref:Uncharacterized protein n=1 Tax=Strigamia maritima TaxID=126957 RepID=T1JC17_STRMM